MPTSRTQQQQPSKGRGDGWNGLSEGSQGCRADFFPGLCPQNRNTYLTGRPDRLLQASKGPEFVRETRTQLGVHQRRGRQNPNERYTTTRTMNPVVQHSPQRQVTEARPKLRQRPWPVAQEYAAKQELTGTIHSLANGKTVDRTESPLSCSKLL